MDKTTHCDRYSSPLLSVEEALSRILTGIYALPPTTVSILTALGGVLAEDVRADRDLPPWDNAAMDGYAVRADDLTLASPKRPVHLRIIAEILAGDVTDTVVAVGEAAKIMTGAPLPQGANSVVRSEDTTESDGWVEFVVPPARGINIRRKGEDVRADELVLPQGTLLRPPEIAMLAAIGRRNVKVISSPRVAILATGDEVVEIDSVVEAGQIRNSNSYGNAAQVLKYGGVPLQLGIARDRIDAVMEKIEEGIAAGADLFVISGGVAGGMSDLVKEVVTAHGKLVFWRVNMKPGRPLAFGYIRKVPLLCLPGNPVAAMISFELFARPTILKMRGYHSLEWPSVTALLRAPIKRNDNCRHYLRVRLHTTESGWEAELTGDQGSGILTSLVRADGLAVLPEEHTHLPAGSSVRVLLLNNGLPINMPRDGSRVEE
ncbi:molybdopterin molybdotransferase MoeA [Candidatus Acetothermia bacterium]|nr:molybdopterin molybdotransferase MoeA [Candidatus Acetothermia bacterium]MCI2427868.1 molybdopterin molybdotransferase MoeA [Candidatus Acetothermia bacterium]MCI2428928.1 molybdopterin molybdotransferase MoeA [Candidatus Acetothermia bacterium]